MLSKTTEYPPCSTLKEKRVSSKMTQKQLAILASQKSGRKLSSNYVSRFETGLDKPWIAARNALALALDMKVDDLFPELEKL